MSTSDGKGADGSGRETKGFDQGIELTKQVSGRAIVDQRVIGDGDRTAFFQRFDFVKVTLAGFAPGQRALRPVRQTPIAQLTRRGNRHEKQRRAQLFDGLYSHVRI